VAAMAGPVVRRAPAVMSCQALRAALVAQILRATAALAAQVKNLAAAAAAAGLRSMRPETLAQAVPGAMGA
jgi:hypothetical protein